jgi:putative ABC transport system permease protein
MKPDEALRMAARSLWSHKLRTTLTTLGVVIGIGSVLAVVTLSGAFEGSITSQFDSIDDRAILVTAGTGNEQGPPDAGPFGLIFTEVDRQNLAALPGVDEVSASGMIPVTGLTFGGRSIPFDRLQATTTDSGDIREPKDYLSGGVFRTGERQAVLGHTIATLLGNGTAIAAGSTIRVEFANETQDVVVAGVLAKQDSLFGSNNRAVFVPVDPFYDQRRTSPSTGERTVVYMGFTVFASDIGDVRQVRGAVDSYMQEESDASKLLTSDVKILVATASDITNQIGDAFSQVTIFIAGIAGVSLLVAGVMIATIQLVTVTERTQEIGILKAIGARNRDVLGIFLVEAALIGLIGGVLGIGVGLAAGYGLVQALFGGEVAFVISWGWVVVCLLFAGGVGILAGTLPARRATRVDPVQALTRE